MQVYFDNWAPDDRGRMLDDFGITAKDLKGCEVLFAQYGYYDYSGSSLVLFSREGKLYEVNGGHCSDRGLEGQWVPELTSWAALRMRNLSSDGMGAEALAAFDKLRFAGSDAP